MTSHEGILELFQFLGNAKHEPCGENVELSYGDSAWRMAIMALCLNGQNVDRKRLAKMALSSSLET